MKITNKELYSSTEYYSVSVEMADGREIIATYTVFDDKNLAIPERSVEIIDDGDKVKNKAEEEAIKEFILENFDWMPVPELEKMTEK